MAQNLLPHLLFLLSISSQQAASCDLEQLFVHKRSSIESSLTESPIAFKGIALAMSATGNQVGVGEFTARFEILNIYRSKGALRGLQSVSSDSKERTVNVTIMEQPTTEWCADGVPTPVEYIVLAATGVEKVTAVAIVKWSEGADQRVWLMLGWDEWGEWSSCSVSCSSGIQQRVRHCLRGNCPGHNVEQRHCNMFECDKMINPLTFEDGHFFHPSKDNWKNVPDRQTAWRLEPYTYLWVPSFLLLAGLNITQFPKQFSIFFTVRLQNETSGTIFSLRSRTLQDTYLSIDFRGDDLKLVHAAQNGSDTVIAPVNLADEQWHQIAISIRDSSIVDCFVDCTWVMTDILKSTSLDLPEDSDLIVGYLFSGDLEQLSIAIDPSMVNQQCSATRIPIIDPSMDVT